MMFDQVSMPGGDSPGELWSKITAPMAGVLAGAWWFVLHIVVPGALIVGVAMMVVSGFSGNKAGMTKARHAIMAVPLALILAGIAVLVANWAIGAYA